MSPTTALFAIVLAAAAQAMPGLPLPVPPVVSHRVSILRDWVNAVERHTPGEADAAALMPAAWSRDDLQAAWIDVQVLIALLRNHDADEFHVQYLGNRVRANTPRQDVQAFRDIARAIVQQPGADRFLKRAAVLHTDTAMLVQGALPAAELPSSMLIPRRVIVQTGDGQQVSMHGGGVSWEFARLLLDAVREPSRDADVNLWYRATLAQRLGGEELDTPHFARARQLFPDDAEITFLTGALHEVFADARVQTVARTIKLRGGALLEIGSEASELREAEALFRRALELDAGHVEARLRRGRTLGRLGRHQEAVAELRRVLGGTREPLLLYYAELFAGAEEEALAQWNAAGLAYQHAAALYPRAQAPRLALSHLAHRTGNRSGAREALSPVLRAEVNDLEDDPWWIYRLVPGRQAADRLGAMYRALWSGERP
jgi:tetratricopeptide (TPR) repeat protein